MQSVDLNAIIIREIEAVVDMLERKTGEVDRALLLFLEKHISRYITMVKLIRKTGENAPEITSAKALSDRIAKLMERAGSSLPEKDTEVFRQFIEAEDAEILSRYLEELKAENEKLKNFIEQEDTSLIKRKIEELERERDELKKRVESQQASGEVPSEGAPGSQQVEEEIAKIKVDIEARIKGEYEKLLEDARREVENYKQRLRVIGTKFRELQGENASLVAIVTSMQVEKRQLLEENSQWRKKFNDWQKTLDDLAAKRARAMLSDSTRELTETIAQLRHKEKVLNAIQSSYDIIQDRNSETCLVIPKAVSQALMRSPGSKIKMEVQGTTITYLKG